LVKLHSYAFVSVLECSKSVAYSYILKKRNQHNYSYSIVLLLKIRSQQS